MDIDYSSKEWKGLVNRGRKDPVVFANKILGIRLHPGQEFYLRNFWKYKHYLLSPSNQWGKSLVVAVLHIWCNFYKFGLPKWDYNKKSEIGEKEFKTVDYQTLNLSPRLRQARLVYKYILDILNSRFTWYCIKFASKKWETNKCLIKSFLVRPDKIPHDTSLSSTPIEFNMNYDKSFLETLISSRVYIASTSHDKGASIAGDQFALISYDECALSNYLEEELGNYIWSRLIKYDGKLHLISTPDEDSDSADYFTFLIEQAEEDMKNNTGDWGFQLGKMTDNTFLDKEKIDKQKEQMKRGHPLLYEQVFEGKVVGSALRFFTNKEIENIFEKEINFLPPQEGHSYIIGADFAVAQNYTVYIVIDITLNDEWYLVKMVRFKGEKYNPDMQLEILADLSREYNMAEIVYDASSLAGPFVEFSSQLEHLYTYPNKFDAEHKLQLLVALKKVLGYNEVGKIRAPVPSAENKETIGALKRELQTYRQKDRKKIKDSVMALGLCAWRMEDMTKGGEINPFQLDFLAT